MFARNYPETLQRIVPTCRFIKRKDKIAMPKRCNELYVHAASKKETIDKKSKQEQTKSVNKTDRKLMINVLLITMLNFSWIC